MKNSPATTPAATATMPARTPILRRTAPLRRARGGHLRLPLGCQRRLARRGRRRLKLAGGTAVARARRPAWPLAVGLAALLHALRDRPALPLPGPGPTAHG